MYHYTLCGLDNVWLVNGYTLHETEYGPGISFDDADGLDRAIAMHLIENKPRLSGKEFRFLRKEMLLSQHALAEFLGNDEQSVAKWEKTGRVPKWADRFIRIMASQFFGGNAKLVELIGRLNNIDREHSSKRLQFKETNQGWMLEAA